MTPIVFSAVSKRFGDTTVFDAFSGEIKGRGITAVMGESGKGKTTLLSLLLGIEKPDSGRIDNPYPRIACAFQDPRLLPWKTAKQNVTLVLSGKTRREKNAIADALLEKLDLTDSMSKYPGELSGGMQQRVSLARAFAYDADLLLLDEPFRGLDEENKARVLALIREKAEKIPIVLVTHDKTDVDALGATLLLLE